MPLPTREGRARSAALYKFVPVQHRAIAIFLGLFIVLGVLYSLVTPLFEASDELWHYPFVKRLADGEGLPVQYPDQIGPWRQEGSQPPLYYALGAFITSWIDTDDMGQLRWINPHADIGIPTSDRNVNMVVHRSPLGGPEPWPWSGAAWAMYLVRWMSLCMGTISVLMGYLLAREIYPHDARLALSAAAITGLNPMFLFITSSVNNDALVIMLCAISLWLMARYLAAEPRWWRWVLLGLVLGLSGLAKASALGLLPLAALTGVVVSWRARRGRPWRWFWGALVRTGLLIGLPLLLVAGWWYYRNWLLYRDPLGLEAFVAIVGARYPRPTLGQLLGEWKGFVMSYWGFFGGVNVPAPDGVYWYWASWVSPGSSARPSMCGARTVSNH
jgi:4-amino-4-deoxy-L-arabinose transferase-like glycosyltransferase